MSGGASDGPDTFARHGTDVDYAPKDVRPRLSNALPANAKPAEQHKRQSTPPRLLSPGPRWANPQFANRICADALGAQASEQLALRAEGRDRNLNPARPWNVTLAHAHLQAGRTTIPQIPAASLQPQAARASPVWGSLFAWPGQR